MKTLTCLSLLFCAFLVACCCSRGARLDLLPIDPDIDLHMAAVERAFDDLYSNFTNLRQDYNKHLTRHFEYQEPQYDSSGDEVIDTTPIPEVYGTPYTAYCELDYVTYETPSNKMPITERIVLLDKKQGLFDACVKKFTELYFGHLSFCHGIEKPVLESSYKPLTEGLTTATEVRLLDKQISEFDTLVTNLLEDYDEHLKGHY